MQYRLKFRFSALLLAALLTACTAVEETGNADVTVITPATLEKTSSAAVTSAAAEKVTDAETLRTTTQAVQTTQTVQTETEAVPNEITAVSAISQASGASQTSRTSETMLTLQYESPEEDFETQVQTVASPMAMRSSDSYSAVNYNEQKGFWITYLEYASILRNKSEKSFKKSVGEYFDNIAGLGFNTVYVQVRAFGDAYYQSDLFPSGEQFDGTIGTENAFDALQVMIDCAHERGLSIHAWVNPMRLMTTKQLKNIDSSYIIKKWYNSKSKNGCYIVKSGDRWYLNPAYGEVTDLIADGIKEIVSNYKVDGIQIDDYFYPTTDKSFDAAAYKASGTELSLSEWRTANVSKMVKKLYKAAHSQNSSVVFGISPQGSVENNYSQLYADVKTWCSKKGYCDYILPQVYFGFKSEALPYKNVIAEWNKMVNKSDVKLVIGLAAYKIGEEDKWAGKGSREWQQSSDILSRQMAAAEELSNYGGTAIYRYQSLFEPETDVAKQVNKELKNIEK